MSQWSQCRVMVMSQGHIEVIAPHPCITHHRFMEILCTKSDYIFKKTFQIRSEPCPFFPCGRKHNISGSCHPKTGTGLQPSITGVNTNNDPLQVNVSSGECGCSSSSFLSTTEEIYINSLSCNRSQIPTLLREGFDRRQICSELFFLKLQVQSSLEVN